MEDHFKKACQDGIIPGMVLIAASKSGKFKYREKFGTRSLKNEESKKPLDFDSLLRCASASKFVTSIMAMQCVDRGLIGLDDDVRDHVPDLKDIEVLTGYDERENPVLVSLEEKLTLRRLLTHSSGFAYDLLSPLLLKWRQQHNTPPQPSGSRLTDRFLYPLISQPGTEWMYSPSIDWTGRVIECVTGQKLDDFMQENVTKPLGISRMTFFAQKHPELLSNHADMTVRDENTGSLKFSDENYWREDPEDAMGGQGIFASASDFFEVVYSILRDDGKLLSTKVVKELMQPQLTKTSKESLKDFLKDEKNEKLGMGGFFAVGSERDHSLGGMVLVEDVPKERSPRRPGTIAWMGLPNFYWFLDPTAGICAIFASQIKPSDDLPTHNLMRIFEKEIYERMYEAEKSG